MNNNCTIRIQDEVTCMISNLRPEHLELFYNTFGIFAPNYYFNPKFKLGVWDGKIRFFTKTGKTYVNLLEDIIPKIVGLGYKIDIDDKRKSAHVSPNPIDEDFFKHIIDPTTKQPWKMRQYQVEFINVLLNNGSGVGVVGTGGGKTSVTAAMALCYEQAANFRSIIIVPDKYLTKQTWAEYAFFELDVGEYSGSRKDVKHKHVVSTWQALKNLPELLVLFQVVIVDECHGIKGNTLTKLLTEHANHIPYRFGVTGTLPKQTTDALAVKIAVGPTRYVVPAHQLIEQGYLADLHIDILQHDIDLKDQYNQYLAEWEEIRSKPEKKMTYVQFKNSYFPELSLETHHLQHHTKRLVSIARLISKIGDEKKGNCLCLVNNIRFGKKLTTMIKGAHFVYGQNDVKIRRQVYDLFENNNDVVVIATVQVAGTGLNILRIFNLLYVDMGKSFIRVIQTIGRGLRRAHDKESVNIIDICADLKYSKRHVRERIRLYEEAKYPYKKYKVNL